MTGPQQYESALDRQIRIAQEQGRFDDLPGKGKPLPDLDAPLDENWWLKGYLKREGISAELLLPTSVQLRKELDRLPATLRELPTEAAVRETVRELNRRIAEHLRFPSGPRVRVAPVRVDEAVAEWRAECAPAPSGATVDEPAEEPEPGAQRRWWQLGRRARP